jgi:hypothetical protein
VSETAKHILILSLLLVGIFGAMICGNILIAGAMREGIYKHEAMEFFTAVGLYMGSIMGGMLTGVCSILLNRRS